ncbi:MAG: hypothetical protein ACRBC3_13875 [Burkholderiaceae bacterium]
MSNTDHNKATPDLTKKAMLKPTLIGVATVVVIGLALATFALLDYQEKVESRELDITRLAQAHRQLSHLKQEASDAARAMPEFAELQRTGILSPLAKTREIDRFVQSAGVRPAGVASFSLGGIETLTPPPDLPLVELELGRHELTFDATPRHEIHLLHFLDDLRNSLDGLALVRACSMQRSISMARSRRGEEDEEAGPGESTLHAQCSIDWYLFNERKETTEASVAAPIPQGDF